MSLAVDAWSQPHRALVRHGVDTALKRGISCGDTAEIGETAMTSATIPAYARTIAAE
jgi:hypothetical protein